MKISAYFSTTSFSRKLRRRPAALATSIATLVASLLVASSPGARAASALWFPTPTNGNWVTGGAEMNWNTGPGTFPGGAVPNLDVASFVTGSTTTAIVINDPALHIAGITFDNMAGNFTIGATGGNPLLLDGGTIVIAASLVATNAIETINAPLVINGNTGFINHSASGTGVGAGTLIFNGAISGGPAGANITLSLLGANANANTIAGNISNGLAASVQVSKAGAGTWRLNGTNTYTGTTVISAGVLEINNGSALGASGLGSDTFIQGGAELRGIATLTLTETVYFAAIADATLSATTGSVMTFENLVLQGAAKAIFGSAGHTGVIAVATPALGMDFNVVNPTKEIVVAFGTLRDAGNLSFFTGSANGAVSTTVNAGATLDTFGIGTIVKNLLGAGTLTNDGAAAAAFTIQTGIFTGQIKDGASPTGFTKDGPGTLTFTGAAVNTYTGPTNIHDGTVLLDAINATNAGISSAVVNIGDGVGGAASAILRNGATGENINDAAAVTINSDGRLDLNGRNETIGSLAGIAGAEVTLGSGALTTGGNNTSTSFGGTITGLNGRVTKTGTGTWTINGGSSTFTDAFMVQDGTVVLAGAASNAATGQGDLLIGDGAGAPRSAVLQVNVAGGEQINNASRVLINHDGNLHLKMGPETVGSVSWIGGNIQLVPGSGDFLAVTGAFDNAGSGGAYVFDLDGLAAGTTYTLTTFGTTTFTTPNQFSAVGPNGNLTYQGTFLLNPNNVQFTLAGATATGAVLQNSAPVGVPTFADFIVNGPVSTGGPTDNNSVNSLVFAPNSSLTVFNTLFVTQGPVNLVSGSSLHLGTSPLGSATLSASQLKVLFGGTLTGNGTIRGDLVSGGLVSPGNSPGVIYVSGNYRQTSTGTLRIEIGGTDASEHDRLIVGGRAELDGTLELVRLNRFTLKRGDKITFLTAGGGVDGEFARVSNGFTTDTILEPTVVYEDTSVALELVRGSFAGHAADWGLTPNQRAVAKTLDRVSADDADDKALLFLDARSLGKLPEDFDRIAPEELTSIFTISTALAHVQSINLQRRTDDIRSGSSGFSASGLAMQGTGPGYSGAFGGAAGPSGNEGKESKGMKTTVEPDERKWGAFLTGVGEWVDVDGDGNARGYDITTGGFTLGLDYKVSPNFALGVMAGYAGTSSDLTEDGRVWVNGGKLGLYATYFTGGFYVDAAVSGGYNSYDTKRSALQGTARGSTDGGELNVLVGTGYDWKVGALSIGPTATFQYTLVGMDGFTERGSLAPLNIAARNAESVRSAFGARASYDWKCGGVLVKPEIRAAWQHEYGDSSYGLDASFASGAGNGFLVNGPEVGRDSLLIGAGFAVQLSETCSTYVYYDGDLFRDSYESHNVSGGVRISF